MGSEAASSVARRLVAMYMAARYGAVTDAVIVRWVSTVDGTDSILIGLDIWSVHPDFLKFTKG